MVQQNTAAVRQRLGGRRIPQRLFGPAGAGHRRGRERIDRLALVADRQVQVREFGQARQADQPEPLAGTHRLPAPHRDAALGQMAVLCLPAIGVAQHQAVAAFAVLDGFLAGFADRHVGHAVAHTRDHAVGGRQHRHARTHRRHRRHAKIGAVVPVVRARTARVVAPGRRRVVVHIVLHEAGLAGHTVDRQGKTRPLRPLARQGRRHAAGQRPGQQNRGKKAEFHAFSGSNRALPSAGWPRDASNSGLSGAGRARKTGASMRVSLVRAPMRAIACVPPADGRARQRA